MIGIIGLSHKSAPVHIREKFALDKDECTSLTKLLKEMQHIEEVVILSTCNRTEVYFKANKCCSENVFKTISQQLIKHAGGDKELEKHFYRFEYDNAITHLFRVVSSLESMVLGEYQIVSQIKESFNNAKENKSVGKVFKRLFNKALETSKQVRTNTEMSTGAFSVSYAAVEKCNEIFENLSEKKILLIGAGETGELVIKNLYKKGCKNITVTNRTINKSQELAKRYEGKAIPYSQFEEGILNSEIIVCSVSSKEPILTASDFENYKSTFPKVLMIDLGVPRNIDDDLTSFENVSLINIDDLQQVVLGNMEKKQAYVSVAEKIITEKVSEYSDWLSFQNLSPAIKNVIKIVNQVNEKELGVFRRYHTEEQFKQMEKYGKHVSEKLINTIIKNLKEISDNGRETEYVKVINDLFTPINEE